MYNSAQVIIDLDEYNDLRKKAGEFEKGSDTKKEDTLALMVAKLLEATSNAKLGMAPNYSRLVLNIARGSGFDIASNNGTIYLTGIK